MIIKPNNKKHSGFTLLFASLIVSLLLAIGLAILHITLEQLLLSTVAKESQFAFYNADTGIECALYYDRNNAAGKIFATSSDLTNAISLQSDISCSGTTLKAAPAINPNDTCQNNTACTTTTFDLVFNAPECKLPSPLQLIHVTVSKTGTAAGTDTLIKSYGYNTCDPNNNRRVERGFSVNY